MLARAHVLGATLVALAVGSCSPFKASEKASENPPQAGDGGAPATTGVGACAHTFCAHFDGEPFDREWTGYRSKPGSDLELQPVDDPAGGRFVRTILPRSDGLYDHRFLRKEVPGGSRKLRYAFSVRITKANTESGYVEVAAIEWESEAGKTRLQLRIQNDELLGSHFRSNPDEWSTSSGSKRIRENEWHSVAIVITPSSLQNTLVEYLCDGVEFASESFAPRSLPTNDVELSLGVVDTGSVGPVAVYEETVTDLDSVAYDAE